MLTEREKIIKKNRDQKSALLKVRHRLWLSWKRGRMQGKSKEFVRSYNHYHRKYWNYLKVKAPDIFSIVDNPEQTVSFLSQIQDAYLHKKKIFVHLHNVVEISNDTLVLLLSHVMQFREAGIDFDGDKPRNEKAAALIQKSGFYKLLFGETVQFEDERGYQFKQQNIFTHARKNVDSELTSGLIDEYSKYIWGEHRRCPGVQRIFLELMQNTNNHASRTVGEKYWWLSASVKEDTNTVCFSFVDYGMGVFESLSQKGPTDKLYGWVQAITKFCDPSNHSAVLREMLRGNLHQSVTNKYYRGKGIPGIYKKYKEGAISRLVMVTNDAYADVSKEVYLKLSNKLSGTYVHFEITKDCLNLSVV